MLLRRGTLMLRSGVQRGLATDTNKKIPQPAKEQVTKTMQSVKEYKDQMKALRRDLQAQGVHLQSLEALREERIEAAKIKMGRKYTPEEKEQRKRESKERHEAYLQEKMAADRARERKRVLKQTMARIKFDAKQEKRLNQQILDLAADFEATWEKPVKEDLRLIVPVNAPFLGVLPKFHSPVAATAFGDEVHRVRELYGPPKPLPPAENQYGGWDPRIVQYLDRRDPSSRETTFEARRQQSRSRFPPRNFNAASASAPPSTSSPETSAATATSDPSNNVPKA